MRDIEPKRMPAYDVIVVGGVGIPRPHYRRFATHYSPHIFALALIDYLEENDVALLQQGLADAGNTLFI